MDENRERKTQYDKGVEHVLVLLSMSVDFYPKQPSTKTLEMLGADESTTDAVYEQLKRFRERIAAEIRSGKDREAAA